MGIWALVIATACYIVTAVDLSLRGNYPMGLTYLFYACANSGLMWAAYRG